MTKQKTNPFERETGQVLYLAPEEIVDNHENPSRWQDAEDLDISDLMHDLDNGIPINTPLQVAQVVTESGETETRLVAGRRRRQAAIAFNQKTAEARRVYAEYEAKVQEAEARAQKAAQEASEGLSGKDAKEKFKTVHAEVLGKAKLKKAPPKPADPVALPCIVLEHVTNERQWMEAAISENAKRAELSQADMMKACARLRETGKSLAKVGEYFSRGDRPRTSQWAGKMVSAYELCSRMPEFADLLVAGKIHIDALASLERKKTVDDSVLAQVAKYVEDGKLSAEEVNKGVYEPPKAPEAKPESGKDNSNAGRKAGAEDPAPSPFVLRPISQLDALLDDPAWQDEQFDHCRKLVESFQAFIRRPTGDDAPSFDDAKRELVHHIYVYSRTPGVRSGKLAKPDETFLQISAARAKEGEDKLESGRGGGIDV